MAAGTTLQHFHTLHAPCAPTTANCYRADTSGEVPHASRPPRLSATAPSDIRHTQGLDEQVHETTGAGSTTGADPCSRFPVGDKRAFAALTVSAPNRSKRGNCCSARTSPALPRLSGSSTVPPRASALSRAPGPSQPTHGPIRQHDPGLSSASASTLPLSDHPRRHSGVSRHQPQGHTPPIPWGPLQGGLRPPPTTSG